MDEVRQETSAEALVGPLGDRNSRSDTLPPNTLPRIALFSSGDGQTSSAEGSLGLASSRSFYVTSAPSPCAASYHSFFHG
jgi:hypothetical protein